MFAVDNEVSAESYRSPMSVTHIRKYRDTAYYICPRCKITLEREFMAYCDRCGQRSVNRGIKPQNFKERGGELVNIIYLKLPPRAPKETSEGRHFVRKLSPFGFCSQPE